MAYLCSREALLPLGHRSLLSDLTDDEIRFGLWFLIKTKAGEGLHNSASCVILRKLQPRTSMTLRETVLGTVDAIAIGTCEAQVLFAT